MKKLLLQILFTLLTFLCHAQAHETNCFLTNSGACLSVDAFNRMQGDSVVFITDDVVKFVHIDSITGFYFKDVKQTTLGIIYGAWIGLITGAAGGYASGYEPREQATAIGALIFTVVGGVVGGFIGHSIKKDEIFELQKWKKDMRKKFIPGIAKYYKDHKVH